MTQDATRQEIRPPAPDLKKLVVPALRQFAPQVSVFFVLVVLCPLKGLFTLLVLCDRV